VIGAVIEAMDMLPDHLCGAGRARTGAYQLKKLNVPDLRFSTLAVSSAAPGEAICSANCRNCAAISEWFASASGTPELSAMETVVWSLGKA
jgi:hypothetical protein